MSRGDRTYRDWLDGDDSAADRTAQADDDKAWQSWLFDGESSRRTPAGQQWCGRCIACHGGRPHDCDRLPAADDIRFVRGID